MLALRDGLANPAGDGTAVHDDQLEIDVARTRVIDRR